MTVRQILYQLEVRGLAEKTERTYKRTSDFTTQMRLDGTIP